MKKEERRVAISESFLKKEQACLNGGHLVLEQESFCQAENSFVDKEMEQGPHVTYQKELFTQK